MAILSRDTSRDAERVQIELLRHASPQQKLEMLRGAIHLSTAFKVDVFVSKLRPFDRSSFARREPAQGEGYDVYVSSAEDTLLAKLDWYREGGELSDQQWRDILAILAVQGDRLDQDYLRTWAGALNVRGLLDRALVESRET